MKLETFKCCGKVFCDCISKNDPVMPVVVGRVYKHHKDQTLHLVTKVLDFSGSLQMVYSHKLPKDPTQLGRDVITIGEFRDLHEAVPLPKEGEVWLSGGSAHVIKAVVGDVVVTDVCGESGQYETKLEHFHKSFEFSMPPHSLECLYGYEISSLNLKDSSDMRLLFWAVHNTLEYDQFDKPIVPTWDINTSHERCKACLHNTKK